MWIINALGVASKKSAKKIHSPCNVLTLFCIYIGKEVTFLSLR